MSKITHSDIQKLDEEEQEVFDAMKELAALGKPHLALLKREMKKRGRSERGINSIVETLTLLGRVSLGVGDREGQYEILEN
jgi:hypothetical protein